MFNDLADPEKGELRKLVKNGETKADESNEYQVLFGYALDDNAGPVISTRQVAVCTIDGQHYSGSWVREENRLSTEVIRTSCDRDANYVHEGWSLSTLSTSALSPWSLSRIANRNQTTQEGSWITKRMIIKCLAVNIPLREVKPVPEFEAEVLEALNKSSKVEQFQAVYEAFAYWGDVIPL
ncbi:hypothetical protein FRC06_006059, partial [Ceratobasidium sp. 370]